MRCLLCGRRPAQVVLRIIAMKGQIQLIATMVTCVYSTNTEMANKFKSVQLGQKKDYGLSLWLKCFEMVQILSHFLSFKLHAYVWHILLTF